MLTLFQSTLPRGSDQPRKVCRLYGYYFNPRSLAGATCRSASRQEKRQGFQSTLPRGSDFDCFPFVDFLLISIHAPSRERQTDASPSQIASRFQSTLPRGSDACASAPSRPRPDFNPRSLAGATWPFMALPHVPQNFNPRSLAGATSLCLLCVSSWIFQSTLPRGSDRQ